MLGWAVVHEHVADEITLLCDKHHKEKTNGLLPIEEVTAANVNPHNIRHGASSPHEMHFSGENCTMVIGENTFTASRSNVAGIVIDEVPIVGFRFEDGRYLLHLKLFDELNELALRFSHRVGF